MRPPHFGAGPRRHVHLGLDPRCRDLRGLDRFRRQQPVGDEEHVGVEARALVPRADLGDDAGQPHRFRPTGHRALADDDVVELQVLVLGEGDPERQRGGVLGAEHPSDRLIAHASDGSAGVRQWSGRTVRRLA